MSYSYPATDLSYVQFDGWTDHENISKVNILCQKILKSYLHLREKNASFIEQRFIFSPLCQERTEQVQSVARICLAIK